MNQSNYNQAHFVAKSIVCSVVILLGVISLETGNPYFSLIGGTLTWFFGVNLVAYLIESLKGIDHAHNIL